MDKPTTRPVPVTSTALLSFHEEFASGNLRRLTRLSTSNLTIDISRGQDSLWAIVRRGAEGGMAIRLAQWPTGPVVADSVGNDRFIIKGAFGEQTIRFSIEEGQMTMLRFTTSIRPSRSLYIPYQHRDLYPLDQNGNPETAQGRIEAAQRGMNAGIVYFRFDKPAFGNVLYVQNLTALNPYFAATGTRPDTVMGGEWPELGFLLPTAIHQDIAEPQPLAAETDYILSDATIVIRDAGQSDEKESALEFLQMLALAYPHMDAPPPEYRDWVKRARLTAKHLTESPKAHVRYKNALFLHPYTDAEYPDSMVQCAVIAELAEYEDWLQKLVPLRRRLQRGLKHFHDGRLKTLRRYLPNVGDDKDADAVDSWYLYHPLLNLGRMAIKENEDAKALFCKSLDFPIEAARHFKYNWPIQFNIQTFAVITEARNEDGLGQTDVGGIYAYVMLQAFRLTGDAQYLGEARAAMDASLDMRFDLEYQANLTAWGAAACMRLWRVTDDEDYLRQTHVYLASFFHNCILWESDIGHAAHYRTFMGASCLQDAPYMAIFECYDSFIAFHHLLSDGGPDIEPAVRLLVSEYCRTALDRAWFYYPDTLPKEALAKDIRNGHIDPALSFPLEDLYASGEPAGQVGQEIYGAGAAFAFLTRSFHVLEGAPFLLFCNHFLAKSDRSGDEALGFQLGGPQGCRAMFCVVKKGRAKIPDIILRNAAGNDIEAVRTYPDRIEYDLPADGWFVLRWRVR